MRVFATSSVTLLLFAAIVPGQQPGTPAAHSVPMPRSRPFEAIAPSVVRPETGS